jgi:hypothetical protein
VSLLSRRSNRHLDDDAFAEIWSTSVASGQPASDPHLDACSQCRARFAAFTNWLDRLRDDACAEADEAFPAERLAAQQAAVMRRLEAIERPARVIAFPRFSRPATSTQGHAQRWVAGAAAAGLVIGLAAGQFVDIRDALRSGRRSTSIQTTRATPPPSAAAPDIAVTPVSATSVSDEALFFGDPIPNARVSALLPMDDITPRARDLR